MKTNSLKNIEFIKILMTSDLHFGMRNISSEEMTSAFVKTIFPLLSETDILFLNGDFFETLLVFDSSRFDPIYAMIIDLYRNCERYGVKLRILQGTWTHDRRQCERFEPFHKKGGFTFDIKYVPNIEVEEIFLKGRSLRIGYIPDNMPYRTSQEIVDVLEKKMRDMGWDYLDYACVHGFFDFTFPQNVSHNGSIVFEESQFPFVKKMIDVGHVHQYRAKGKVISNGSFDRLCFGDEDPKGCIQIIDKGDNYIAKFIKNKHSAIFDTIRFGDEDTTETIRTKIDNHIKKMKSDRQIFLRFIVQSADHRDAVRSIMQEVYKDIKISVTKSADNKSTPTLGVSSVVIKREASSIAPTPKTLPIYIKNHIPSDVSISLETIEKHLQI